MSQSPNNIGFVRVRYKGDPTEREIPLEDLPVVPTNAAVAAAIAEDPSLAWSSLLASGAAVVVDASGTDTDRGTALLAAYTAAKALTPNGAALSATNRAAVVLPVGKYKLATTLELDADFVDLIAQVPTKPFRRLATDVDNSADAVDLTMFRPQPTLVYTEADRVSTIEQTADDVRMLGFTIAQLGPNADFWTYYVGIPDWGALLIGEGSANAPSLYQDMLFYNISASFATTGAVRAFRNFSGTWINCVANGPSFRLGWGDLSETPAAVFSAQMYDCDSGPFSFVGDYPNAFAIVEGARFERCRALGYSWEAGASSGMASFSGCNITAVAVDDESVFVECEAGDVSFGLGVLNEGTYIRCRGGAACFGATNSSNTLVGNFAGYAEDCIGGAGSFGGTDTAGYGKLTGTLVRCIVEGNVQSTRIEGATIRDSRITTATTGIHALTLLDANNVISNSDVIVYQGGTGVPIYAGSALNVAAYHLRMNNASNDADGLGANVTNLVSSAGNVVSDAVK